MGKRVIEENVCVIMELYHYTSFEKAVNFILPSLNLKMNPFQFQNDPLENLTHYSDSEKMIFDYSNDVDIISNCRISEIRKKYQMLCFSKDYIDNGNTESGGLLHRMWSQYGEKNSGICLCIDFDKFIEENIDLLNNNEIKKKDVLYDNSKQKIIPRILTGRAEHSNSNPTRPMDVSPESFGIRFDDFFFLKRKNWENESEYRFVCFSEEEIFLSIKESLKYIILGPHFSKNFIPSVLPFFETDQVQRMVKAVKIDFSSNFQLSSLPSNLLSNSTKLQK